MPELPEVETVRRGLQPAMEGHSFVRVEQRRRDLRFPFPKDFAARLEGRTVTSLARRAKYLIADLDDGMALIMHLGMSGRFIVTDPNGKSREPGEFYHDENRDRTHDHVVFHLS
ncbi:MAG: DNA-formamidopyrimidine glycosylase family protein, partial [Beijerinckiaceae bacterium]